MDHVSIASTQSSTKAGSQGSSRSDVRYMHKVPVLTGKHRDLFWQKVSRGDGCWNWTGGKYPKGYGMVRYQRKNYNAHRLSYAMAYGSVPDGMIVCHKCDNPSCVNPDHLFAGTYQDNVDDMIGKGRKAVSAGEKNGGAKLTSRQAEEIRARYAKGDVTHGELAKEYGVSPALIGLITQGKIWVTVSGPLTDGMAIRDKRPSKICGEKNRASKLTTLDVIELRKAYSAGGVTMRKLSDKYGVCPQQICRLIHGERWKHLSA